MRCEDRRQEEGQVSAVDRCVSTRTTPSRQTQAESPRKPTTRHHSQKSTETPTPQQDGQKEGLQTGGNLISDTESDAPANTRNRGKRVGMLDDSDDDNPSAEKGSGCTVKSPRSANKATASSGGLMM